jgi:copper chaperone CopZ
MTKLNTLALTAAFVFLTLAAQAAEVEVTGLNLCCGDSGTRLEAALKKAEGISDIVIDQRTGSVAFQAIGDAAVKAALEQIGDVGLAGSVTVDGQKAEFPKTIAPKRDDAKQIVLVGVHLGCRSASDAVSKALQPFENIASITCDPELKTVEIVARGGQTLDVPAIQAALFAAGLNSRVREE